MEIYKLRFNWFQAQLGDEAGEDYEVAEIGKPFVVTDKSSVVKEIKEHRAAGEGDKWYYDILLENNTMIRTFNPNMVFFKD